MLFNGKEEKEGRNKGTTQVSAPLSSQALLWWSLPLHEVTSQPSVPYLCTQVQKRAWSNNVHSSEVLKGVFFVDSVLRFTFKWFFFFYFNLYDIVWFDWTGIGPFCVAHVSYESTILSQLPSELSCQVGLFNDYLSIIVRKMGLVHRETYCLNDGFPTSNLSIPYQTD